jgi:hypothetical protein
LGHTQLVSLFVKQVKRIRTPIKKRSRRRQPALISPAPKKWAELTPDVGGNASQQSPIRLRDLFWNDKTLG